MKKEFIINIILLLSINLLIKVAYLFLIEVNVQNTIGPSSYGLFLAFFNLSYLFHFINDPGIHSYNITNIAGNKNSSPITALTENLPYILGSKLVLGFLYLLILLVAAQILQYENSLVPVIILVGVNHILSSIFLYLRSNFSAIGLYRYESWLSALDKLFMVGIIGVILISGRLSLVLFIAGQTGAFILAIIVTMILLKNKIQLVIPKFSLTYFNNLMRNSLPFALILLLMASYNRMDGVMLERLLEDGDYHAGIYAASFRYMEAANMVVYLIAGLLLPMFASSRNLDKLSELTLLGMRTVAIIAITIAVLIIGFRDNWMGIYTVSDPQYSALIIYHMASFCCIAVSYVYGTLITAQARLRAFNWLLFIGVILNLILNLWLIPRHQAEGAAQATFVTQFVMMAGQIIIARKLYRVPLDYLLATRVVIYALLFSSVMILIREYVSIFWILKIIIGGIISIIIAFLLGVLRKDMIFALIKIKGTKS